MLNLMLADELSGLDENITLPIAAMSDENHFDAEDGIRKDVMSDLRVPSLGDVTLMLWVIEIFPLHRSSCRSLMRIRIAI